MTYGPWVASKLFTYDELAENALGAFYILQQMIKEAYDEKASKWDLATLPKKTIKNIAILGDFSFLCSLVVCPYVYES